jgi:dihydroxyacetone kinase
VQKFLNRPSDFVDEALEGILSAHPNELRNGGDRRVIVHVDAPEEGRVGIATGGGFGHLPLFLGYVGKGLADGVAVGNVFASPSSDQILKVTRAIDGGAGVLYLYGNYAGDVLNFELAAELAADEGIPVEMVVATDDVASAPKGAESTRRGVAGIFFAYKAAGASASEGRSLAEVKAAAERAVRNTRSLGVALGSCTLPGSDSPNFEVAVGHMEVGMGIHGEPGVQQGVLQAADAIAERMVASLTDELALEDRSRVVVLMNGLGGTSREELYVLYRTVKRGLDAANVTVERVWIGEYATSFEMAGASVSLLKLDSELSRLVAAPAHSPLLNGL